VQSGFLDSFPFDPASLDSEVNQVKELKNGRLAMVRPSLCLLPAVSLLLLLRADNSLRIAGYSAPEAAAALCGQEITRYALRWWL
jgi:hypothetical protein